MQVKILRTYRFTDKDPVIDACATILKDEGLKVGRAAIISGLAASTLDGWFKKDTRRPQNASISAFTSSLGYVRRDTIDPKSGQLQVRYVRALTLDFEAEKEKAIRFAEKHARPKRRKKNTNGHT